MKTATLLYDTSAYISYPLQTAQIEPGYYSTVVLQELLVGASGKTDLQKFSALRFAYAERGRLLCPDEEAGWQAGKILNHILNDESRHNIGRERPRFDHARKQNIIRDVLIAVSAKQTGVTIISDNKDFPLIQRYYVFRWMRAAEFFA